MFWLAYVFTVIVGGTFAVILRVLRKVLRSWGRLRTRYQNAPNPLAVTEHRSESLLFGAGCWSVNCQIEESGFEGSRTVEQVESVAEMPGPRAQRFRNEMNFGRRCNWFF